MAESRVRGRGISFAFSRLLLGALASSRSTGIGAASLRRPDAEQAGARQLGERINANTIAIVSGNLNATYVTIAYDLSAVLDNGDEFRVLPVIGKGGGQNIKDVRFLKGVDLGITQSNLLTVFQRTNEIGPIDDKIVYIAKLFNEEMHLVVRADSGISSIASTRRQEGQLLRHRLAARSCRPATSSSGSASRPRK